MSMDLDATPLVRGVLVILKSDMHRPGTAAAPMQLTSLVELLELRAREDPERLLYTFLVDGEDEVATFTNRDLRNRARAIAAVLQEAGVQGERALLLHAPGLDYIAAFFGCLYAGVIAVPAYPPDPQRLNRTVPRLQAIVRDAQASIALTSASMLALTDDVFAAAPDLQALRWVATDAIAGDHQDAWRPPSLQRESLAFLQYTSGSTSTPKGVELTHANLFHNLELIRQVCPVVPASAFVSWLPPYHDMGLIACIIGPLYAGVHGVLMSPLAFLERPLRWLQAISRYRGTITTAPNFAFDLCVNRVQPQDKESLDLRSLAFLGSGGEPIRADTIQRFLDTFAACGLDPEAFHPLFGLAEASLFVSGARPNGRHRVMTLHRWALEHNRVIPAAPGRPSTVRVVGCGKPMLEDRIVIVDPTTLIPCRARQIGEIWISSPSVARGYWNRPEVSEEIFRAHLADRSGGPFLRTGDLGFLDEEELFVTGRLKDLIIINGTNHYAEDIELTVQSSHGALRRGCGAAFPIDDDGQERLVVVQEVDTRQAFDAATVVGDIRQALSETHQLTAHAVVLIKPGSIPKTSSGKIQRHACRAEFLERKLSVLSEWATAARLPARHHDSIEALLITEIAAELGRDAREIDPSLPITRYGPDSLAAYNVAHRIETATGFRLDVGSILDGVTIRELGKQILDRSSSTGFDGTAVAVTVSPSSSPYPLSHGQEALWFLHQLAPESSAYHVTQAARLVEPLSMAALRAALQALVRRHPSLRTTFVSQLGRPLQQVHEDVDAHLVEWDAAGWTQAQVDERLHEEAYQPFDLEHGPLLRVAVCHGSASGTFLVVAAHHIVSDLWSLAIIVRELGILYTAARQGVVAELPPLPHQYVDYVAWQTAQLAGGEGERLWMALRERFASERPLLDLPTDRPRPPMQTFRGATYRHKLDRLLTSRLRTLGQEHGATLYMTLLAAFQVFLYRHCGQSEFLIGSPTAGRTRPEWAGVVGYFINPVVLAADLSTDPAFTELLAAVRLQVITALATADYPFALLVEKLQPVRDPSRSPIFQVLFAMESTAGLKLPEVAAFALGEPGVRLSLGELHLESYPLRPRASQLDLTLMVAEVDGEICASWEYNTDLFDETTIARMAQRFETLLSAIVGDATQTVSTLPILSTTERQQLLVDWTHTERVFDSVRCLHQLFEEQVQRTPDAVAVLFGSDTLTYRELDRRANQLAHHLHGLGVVPEVPVALCVERSLDMMVALFGILKAGGAYLPLDPDYPVERLMFMLDDAEPPVLVTHGDFARRVPSYAGTIVHLDEDAALIAGQREDPVQSGVIPTNLAYIIYTSGSTGRPKGVMNTHSAVCNCLLWLQDTFALCTGDRLLQITPLSFDVSITECFWPLAVGARLTLAAPGGQRDAAYLVATMSEDQTTVLQVVPSALRLLLDQPGIGNLGSLRLVICTAEELRYDLNERYFARMNVDLYNLYGPTEASIWATYWKCRPGGADGVIPIGRPLSNVKVRILEANLELAPIGVPGELHIGGAGLARGYLNRPALTAERFIDDPFSREPRERLYKTGDLTRYRADGSIEYLGRLDHQVKVRGHRIELGEIEAVLGEHMTVQECAVLARDGEEGEQRLIAYVVPRWERGAEANELRAFLKVKLPEYMLPASFVTLPALPLTASGKLDRNALPAPGRQRPQQDSVFVAPRNAEEFRLCELWAEVLGLELVGIHDDFFELGGDSLRAAQLAAKIDALMQRQVSVKFVIQHRNVAAAVAALPALPPRLTSPAPATSTGGVGKTSYPSTDHVTIEHRSLLALFAAGKIAPVQAAAITYFPTALIEQAGLTRAEVIDGWCQGLPLFTGVYDSAMGRIATVMLPRFSDQLYDDKAGLLRELVEALELAGRLGARTVSLTGLLPSATGYGHDLVQAVLGKRVPQITTGHATTAATVVLAIKKMLAASRRDLAHERVAFLGLGSIGAATLEATLQLLPHPLEILLCDLATRHDHLQAVQATLVEEHGYHGPVRLLEAQAQVPAAIYEASLIVGATNVADVLDVDRLQPGSMLVDDSAPHCFNPERAIDRLTAQRDILFSEGGVLRAPHEYQHLRYVPRAVDAGLLRAFDLVDPREITGCIFSSGLTTRVKELTSTIGLVDGNSTVSHFRVLEELGFEAGNLRCGGVVLSESLIRAFRERFGVGS